MNSEGQGSYKSWTELALLENLQGTEFTQRDHKENANDWWSSNELVMEHLKDRLCIKGLTKYPKQSMTCLDIWS